MVRKSLRNKFLNFGLALSFAAAAVGFALGGSPRVLEADADFAPSSVGYPYGTRFAGSLWQFKSDADFSTFPIYTPITVDGSIYEEGYSYTFDEFTIITFTGSSLTFTGVHDSFEVNSSNDYKFKFYLLSDNLFTPLGYPYEIENRNLFASWLAANCLCLEPPNDDIPENGISLSDNSTLLFFRISELLALNPSADIEFYDMRRDENLYVDMGAHKYLMPYSIDFYDTTDGFRISNIRLVGYGSTSLDMSNVFPWIFLYDGTNLYMYGHLFTAAGSSSSNWVGSTLHDSVDWNLYRRYGRSGDSAVFGFAPSELLGFFSNEVTPGFAYLERIRNYVNFFLGYSQFVYSGAPYGEGYDNGYRQGYDDGNRVGNDAGYRTGYQTGYNAGVNSVTSGTSAVVSLFGGIASVPMSILNGLGAFTIWNVPIISILSTFLFIALIAFVIRKLVA